MLLEVGRIIRVHGLRGEVVVDLSSNVEGRLAKGSTLYADANGSDALVVASSRPHQKRWLVQFESIADRNAAEHLGRPKLFGEPIDDPDAVWVHELFDMTVVDADGVERGTVVEVIDNPASELMLLDTGHLVPLDFVVSTEGDRIAVEVPDGLWDLIDED